VPLTAKKTAKDISASEWREIQQRVECGESINSVSDSVIPSSGRAFREVVRRRCNSEQWAYPHKMGEQIEALKQDRIADNVILGHDTAMDRACAVLLARQGACVVIVSRQEKRRILLLGANAKGVSAKDLDVIAMFPEGFLDEGGNRAGDMSARTESSPGTYSAASFAEISSLIEKIPDPVKRREARLANDILETTLSSGKIPVARSVADVDKAHNILYRALGMSDESKAVSPMLNLTFSSGSTAEPVAIQAEVIPPKALE
jgi:hypothetical protein